MSQKVHEQWKLLAKELEDKAPKGLSNIRLVSRRFVQSATDEV